MKTMRTTRVKTSGGEFWWGGAAHLGPEMPWGGDSCRHDIRGHNHGNQASPLLLSSHGRVIWSEEPFAFAFDDTLLSLESSAEVVLHKTGGNLAEAFRTASGHYFPPSGATPPELFFSAPQYNTWIEMQYAQEQGRILDYAQSILDNGFPPGVLMIDDGWQKDIGDWNFAPERFSDPREMVDKLHVLGFRVMLWMVPLVSPDSAIYRRLSGLGALLLGEDGKPTVREWWNGQSACLDLHGAAGAAWLREEIARLQIEFGVDGFKFDGGDCYLYRNDDLPGGVTPNDRCRAYAEFGAASSYNEFRACWKMGGQALVQRQHDKLHTWGNDGLAALIPTCIAQGLIGHPFNCPDMIGGGDVRSFEADNPVLDQELVVRYAQCSALMPMMQFSVAPWRILDPEHLDACRRAVSLREQHAGRILKLARQASITGEPIVRPLCYHYPEAGLETVTDQFLLGDSLLVAPVLEKGAHSRTVVLPEGVWLDLDGREHRETATAEASLDSLPVYARL